MVARVDAGPVPSPARLSPRWERSVRIRHDVRLAVATFDLVAFDRSTGAPRLVLDLVVDPSAAPDRPARVEACRSARVPYVVVSYETESDRPGRAGRIALVQTALDELLSPFPLPDRLLGSRDPLARRAHDFRKELPGPIGERHRTLFDRSGWIGTRLEITGAISIGRHGTRTQTLVRTQVHILELDGLRGRAGRLLRSIGLETLYRKAARDVGTDSESWRRRARAAPWST